MRSDPFVGALVQSSKCTPVLLQSGRTARGGGFVVPVTQLVLHKPLVVGEVLSSRFLLRSSWQ